MRRLALLTSALLMLGATAAGAQTPGAATAVVPAGATLLNVTAEGRVERSPDLATFNAGVVTQAKTAGEAMSANSERMDATIAALKRAGVADRDIQTSNLNLQPQHYYPQRDRTQPAQPEAPRIVGYEARNTVTVRVRKLAEMGKIIDALVGAGANQIDGPYFSVEDPAEAANEARAEAMKEARERAEIYARSAGLRVGKILTITEGGGYYPIARDTIMVTSARLASAPPAPPPPPTSVQAGEVALGVTVSVQYALEP